MSFSSTPTNSRLSGGPSPVAPPARSSSPASSTAQSGCGTPSKAPGRRSKKAKAGWFVPTVSLTCWMLSSTLLILLNKKIMVDDGFRYPMMLTALGQLASTLAGWLVAQCGLMTLGPPPPPAFYLLRLMPVVVCTAGTLYLGNVAYLSLSVAFIQILKVLTPAITLSVCLLFGLERLNMSLFASVAMITLGTGIATLVEVGAPGFGWFGFIAFVASAFLEAIRVVLIQMLLGSLKYNAIEVLVFLGPPTAALLLGGAYVWEWEGLTSGGFHLMQRSPLLYLLAIFTGFLVNITTASAIKTTSSLTFKVFGCVKNTVVVVFGMVYGDVVTLSQLLGYAVSVAGFGLYTHHKWAQTQREVALRKTAKKAQ